MSRRTLPDPAEFPLTEHEAREVQAAWADYLNVPTQRTNSIGMSMVLIPPGQFDGASGTVSVTSPVYMAAMAVTQEQYIAVMGSSPAWHVHRHGLLGKLGLSKSPIPELPVENVTWNQAVEFCRGLTTEIGFTTRLPLEEEWEYACRAGTMSDYHFGDALVGEGGVLLANFGTRRLYGSDLSCVCPAGGFPPNAWGLFDMHGNVSEWCADTGRDGDTQRGVRGGSYLSAEDDCRSAARQLASTRSRARFRGFRPVFEPPDLSRSR